MKKLMITLAILFVGILFCGCSDELYVDVVDPVPQTTIYLGGYRYYHPIRPYYYYHRHYRPTPPPPPGRPHNPGRPGRPGGITPPPPSHGGNHGVRPSTPPPSHGGGHGNPGQGPVGGRR
jgi:hypothetical protein